MENMMTRMTIRPGSWRHVNNSYSPEAFEVFTAVQRIANHPLWRQSWWQQCPMADHVSDIQTHPNASW